MMIDVAVFAGGRGTRLAGLWDGPKCLVPVAGRPVLGRLLDIVTPLHPRRLALLLGHRAPEVLRWYYDNTHRALVQQGCETLALVEAEPRGTLPALLTARPALAAPLLVLNGDTVFRNGDELFLRMLTDPPCVAADDTTNTYAGACVLDALTLDDLAMSQSQSQTVEFYLYLCKLFGIRVVKVSHDDWLDVGTPDGFELAKTWSGSVRTR